MCCPPMKLLGRLLTVLATASAVAGLSVAAQDVQRGGKRQPDPRVRDSGYGGPPAPQPVHGTLVGLHPSGGIIVQDGDQTGVVGVDRSTEIIIRGQADESFVAIGSLIELTGTLEGPKGPISTNYLVLLNAPPKSQVARTRWPPVINVNTAPPGENRPTTATIRGQVLSLNPLVLAANNQKVPIKIEEPVQIWVEILGGDVRALCKEGDQVSAHFQPQQRKDSLIAQTITITRKDPFGAEEKEKAAKDAKKKKDDAGADKDKKAAKGKAGKMEMKPAPDKKSKKETGPDKEKEKDKDAAKESK